MRYFLVEKEESFTFLKKTFDATIGEVFITLSESSEYFALFTINGMKLSVTYICLVENKLQMKLLVCQTHLFCGECS